MSPVDLRRPPKLPIAADAAATAVRFTATHWNGLRRALLDDGHEQSALLFCGQHRSTDRVTFLVREVQVLSDGDYVDRSSLHLSISPVTLARAAKRARIEQLHLVVVHSHPFGSRVAASPIDLRTELELCGRVLPARTGRDCAAMVLGPNGVDARAWSSEGARPVDRVEVIGEQRDVIPSSSTGLVHSLRTAPKQAADADGSTARQELLWGQDGQAVFQRAHVAVVGAGGTGSQVAAQLSHLRVGELTIIDHDVLERSNLSRVIGSTPTDVARPKVDVVADHCRRINPELVATPIQASVLDVSPAAYLDADVIVCATDAHGSRSLLTEVASQYLLPVVDLGVEVDPAETAFRAGGGVRVMRPGEGCLWCAGTLSAALVREEYLSDEEREAERQRGYLRGSVEPAPSVVALNGVVSSLAVLEVCQLLVGMLDRGANRILYRAEQRRLTTVPMTSRDTCHVCGHLGVLGLGDSRRLPTRVSSSTKETA